ncbi:DUF1707 SHOCT-like domain-containing protein [Streptomonospora wellingtoniae]|uniref:DUF1707 domain-containing protein n=1 Tax=Streptomonospora wellingtoniae TaxID=3075544 RepID=A0ABU2KWK4_9ACTN|nr:DUF1707 domain-containing protein [Streptomonospora sp. DSM 45055]MDT0303677.1 DUF1707 domain-containing protein [Streptomonospora sp. DSM 45055]
MSADITPHDELRASDADRDTVARRLSTALSEGRLDMAEYQTRLDSAMGAVTRGELVPLTADLPDPDTPASGPVDLARTGIESAPLSWRERAGRWHAWSGGAVVMIAIWLFTSVASGDMQYFWPAMPLAIWAVVLYSGGGCRR